MKTGKAPLRLRLACREPFISIFDLDKPIYPLIRHADGPNIFIGECKFWKGSNQLSKAINQLFDRYLTWRDTNSAMIIFVKQDGITDIIKKINQTCESHEYFVKYAGSNDDNSFSYIFSSSE